MRCKLYSDGSSNCQPCVLRVHELLKCNHALHSRLRAVYDIAHGAACRDALWLPYRKDRAQLKEAIQDAGDIKAVFAHADVVREAEHRHDIGLGRVRGHLCPWGMFQHHCLLHNTACLLQTTNQGTLSNFKVSFGAHSKSLLSMQRSLAQIACHAAWPQSCLTSPLVCLGIA